MMRGLLLASLIVGVQAHGYVVDPPPRAAHLIKGSVAGSAGSCAAGMCFWFNQGCTIGCPKCTGAQDGTCGSQQGQATLPDNARSYNRDGSCGTNPWCAPGSAPVEMPCGVAGGWYAGGPPYAGNDPPTGSKLGDDARDLKELPTKTTWNVGSVVEIQWAVIANHGGGYQYRLCPKTAKPTEECFQQTPLEFYGDEQWIHYCPFKEQIPPYNPKPSAFPACDPAKRTAFNGTKVSTGTTPEGSTWMRNPVPGCAGPFGGALGLPCGSNNGTVPSDYQFPPPAGADQVRTGQLVGGFGAGGCYGGTMGMHCGQPPYGPSYDGVWMHQFHFNIVDKVVVPNIPPGEYIMGFRWDCEQTAQIWNTCSDITIVAKDDVMV